MLEEKLIQNYNKALSQKYNAVCLDVDGTLTENNSIKIDQRIIPILAEILKDYIPVVFITGRGETVLQRLEKEIIEVLKIKYKVSNKQLSRLYAITNDGARIFTTTLNSTKVFDQDKYIISSSDLENLKNVNSELIKKLTDKRMSKYCNVTHSIDKKLKKIINIIIEIHSNNKTIDDYILNLIKDSIKMINSENINMSIGIFNGNKIIQIGAATKSKAIMTAERIIGIPESSMLRIGDCGDELGNDYSMLNCSQGFSVNKTSKVNDKCFPVINDDKQIITGVDATILLLNKVKLLPTICLVHAIENDYIKGYSKIEKQMNLGKNQRVQVFNNIINDKFKLVDGIYGLYDKSSGSIKIPMYEWICIDDNNPLKIFWNKQVSSYMIYSMFDNENILLRGSQVYYYFLSRRFHNEITGEDVTTKEMVYNWLENNKKFYLEALDAIKHFQYIEDLNDTKMVLALIDNIRNQLLILLNQQIINVNPQKSLLVNLQKVNNQSLIFKIYSILLFVSQMMQKISFDKKYKINIKDVYCLINNAIFITEKFKMMFINEKRKENYSKDFRAYREIDNFAENFITCYLTLSKDCEILNKGVCGLSYGGIELPIITKSINNKLEDILILNFNKNVSGYSKKQSLDLRFFDVFKAGGIEEKEIDKNKKCILMDDNLLTGKTMQLAITSLYDIGINIDKIVVVRYPGVNRISQMFMPNHGAVDYKYFFSFIQGLYFPSPYSWKDPNSLDPYKDSLGIFDLNRRKILECLAKNGDYSQNSEVKYVKRLK